MRMLRMIHRALIAATGFIGLVAVLLPGEATDIAPTLFAAVVIGDAVLSYGMIRWARAKPLDPADPASAAASFRGLYLMTTGLSFAPATVGFIGSVLTGEDWIGLLGVGLALAGLGWLHPTAEVDRRQAALTAAGSPISLAQALDA